MNNFVHNPDFYWPVNLSHGLYASKVFLTTGNCRVVFERTRMDCKNRRNVQEKKRIVFTVLLDTRNAGWNNLEKKK